MEHWIEKGIDSHLAIVGFKGLEMICKSDPPASEVTVVGSTSGECGWYVEVEVMLMTDEMLKGTTRYIPGLKRFLNECGIFQTIKQVFKRRTSSCGMRKNIWSCNNKRCI